MCATSGSINEMILWRAVQGFLGGGMIPSVFAAAFTIFPASKRSIVSPMIGLVATLAPTVGPTVGGYLSHAMSWHWLFLVNVPAGIGVTIGVLALVDFDKPDWSLFDSFDWIGLGALACFLGAMEFVLEEGPGNDWFQDEIVASRFIVWGGYNVTAATAQSQLEAFTYDIRPDDLFEATLVDVGEFRAIALRDGKLVLHGEIVGSEVIYGFEAEIDDPTDAALVDVYSRIMASLRSPDGEKLGPPESGQPEAQTIRDAVLYEITPLFGQPIGLNIERLQIDGGWAYLQAVPVQRNGQPLDWLTTPLAGEWRNGVLTDVVMVLLRREGPTWRIMDYAIGATETQWDGWMLVYGLPEGLFR